MPRRKKRKGRKRKYGVGSITKARVRRSKSSSLKSRARRGGRRP